MSQQVSARTAHASFELHENRARFLRGDAGERERKRERSSRSLDRSSPYRFVARLSRLGRGVVVSRKSSMEEPGAGEIERQGDLVRLLLSTDQRNRENRVPEKEEDRLRRERRAKRRRLFSSRRRSRYTRWISPVASTATKRGRSRNRLRG